jgi:hypothetical protein
MTLGQDRGTRVGQMTSLSRLWTPAGSSGPVNSIEVNCINNRYTRNLSQIPDDILLDRNTSDAKLRYFLSYDQYA